MLLKTNPNQKPYTVLYVYPNYINWEGFNCYAVNADDAEAICQRNFPNVHIIWVNTGHDNYSME